jgi:mannose-1-phosphate guanylyltransferase/mannose-6-phosphate isomerase
LVSVLGLNHIVVVSTEDALLIADRNQMDAIKVITQKLKQEKRPELTAHRRVYRPWGYYQTVDRGDRFQVKRLMLKPGAKTSTQIHHHRSEHWVVVKGTAKITRAEETLLLHENESIYLPMGTKHRLENPGKIPLHLIEVQSGAYLGEDDIVRIDDIYGRIEKSDK